MNLIWRNFFCQKDIFLKSLTTGAKLVGVWKGAQILLHKQLLAKITHRKWNSIKAVVPTQLCPN
ncbi:hypothetical protein BSQ39_03415 [Loigolactobacillus backii]|uniref:Uncharacterized protein n=1 Tax=Loigolactobacillus backii TaxID=375175 RepID=A0A192H1V4_9LACO|nr:hypothetical protein AYR52_08600 [Loigolactobacillus backii]ANK62258.1 hypothetical protein AYR53_05395 [Loigolactobacillus backii]ANK65183.1 hypothetical protein AYR54_08010 [Loigolactobacillus backii]ANK67741.1 hypothetical protein AYR55_08615 [Loigolactobacillus backii]ANK70729.1 hypothetical protein AYR56_11595 [Loigolactobacillus backii]